VAAADGERQATNIDRLSHHHCSDIQCMEPCHFALRHVIFATV
jgi:hypothetical protein